MQELDSSDPQIAEKIYLLRGIKVMLDRDLAEMYDVKPIRLREQVKRNSNVFPNHFMFQLFDEKVNYMVSQKRYLLESIRWKLTPCVQ